MTFPFLTTDAEFVMMIPLIARFCQTTDSMFWKSCHEITSTMLNPTVGVTILGKDDQGGLFGYATGSFMVMKEFYLGQIYNTNPRATCKFNRRVEGVLKDVYGIVRVVGATHLPERYYTKMGWKRAKTYITKDL